MKDSLDVLEFRRGRAPQNVIERFPGRERIVAKLWHDDREFREIYRDYREAIALLRLCEQRGLEKERRSTVAELVAELEEEMLAAVERHR